MRSSPVIKLALEGQGMSSVKRVDLNKYENDIVNELHRRAIEMTRDSKKTSALKEPESSETYKVILKYRDIDGEECMIVTIDDFLEMMQQYSKFANVRVSAQVTRKSDTATSVVDESRDQVEDTASVGAAAWSLKDDTKSHDEEIRDLAAAEEKSSLLTDNTHTLRPFRSLRFLRTKSTRKPGDDGTSIGSDVHSESTKTKCRKKFAFRIPRKMKSKKGPLQLPTFLDPKKISKSKNTAAASEKTSEDDAVSTNKIHDSNCEPTATTTSPTAPTSAATKGSASNALQPVLFVDENGKAVTKVVQDIKDEDISFLQQYASGIQPLAEQDEKEKESMSLSQCAAPRRKPLTSKDDTDRDCICITPPLLGLCQDCGITTWGIPDPTTCCRQTPALPPVESSISTSNRALVGVTAIKDVNSDMMSMDIAEMASIFSAGWWPTELVSCGVGPSIVGETGDAENVNAGPTSIVETGRSSAPAPSSSSGSGGALFGDEQDMQKAMQRFLLLSNDLLANHAGTLFNSASHRTTSGLSTVEELDEESNASCDATKNGRSAFMNYENTEDEHASDTKIPRSASSGSNHGNKNPYDNSVFSISQKIGEVLFSNWSMSTTLSIINEIDEIDQPDIDRDESDEDDHDDDGSDPGAFSRNHPPTNSVTDALLSHLSMFASGGAEKAEEKERCRSLPYYYKFQQPKGQIESEEILCSLSATDPAMPTAFDRKKTIDSITRGVSGADSKDGSTTSKVDQLIDKHDNATSEEEIQYAVWLASLSRTSSILSKAADFSELLSALSNFSAHDSKMKNTSEGCENGVSEWSQESYAGFLLATLSGPLSSTTTSPNSRSSSVVMQTTKEDDVATIRSPRGDSSAVNEDEIQMTLSTKSVKENSNIQDDEINSRSIMEKNSSNSSCREELLSFSDDNHSNSIKKVQSKSSSTELTGKHNQGTQSTCVIDSHIFDVETILSTASTSTGKSKQENTSPPAPSAPLGHEPAPNTETVSATSIQNTESVAGSLLSNLPGLVSSTQQQQNASVEEDSNDDDMKDIDLDKIVEDSDDDNDDDDDMEDFDFDKIVDDSDDDTVPFNLTAFLDDLDDVSAALSGPLCSLSSGQEEETAEVNNDKEEENIEEVEK